MLNNKKDSKKIFNFKITIIILFLILLGRSFYIQIYRGEQYQQLSRENRTSVIPITAPRGRIYDKNNEIIVSNKLAHTVSIIGREANENTIDQLSNILTIPSEEIIEKINSAENNEVIRIKRDISRKELILLEEERKHLSGVLIDQMPIRDYIYDDLASHVLGYIGEISNVELRSRVDDDYSARDIIGKTGIESVYENHLRGIEGKELIEINNLGQRIRTLGIQEPIAGDDLILNIDYKLQKKAEQLLKKEIDMLKEKVTEDDEITIPPRGGAVIVADPRDGSILALASIPSYDLSKFLTGMTTEEWNRLYQDPDRPLLNRAISTSAPPGSIFKLVTTIAAMEELGIKAEDEFYDPGYYELSGVRFRNWYPGGQGDINLLDSIAWSNNTTFYKLGYELYKKDRVLLQSYGNEFGLGSKTGIDLNNETSGLMPDPEWRSNYFTNREDRIWYPGYTINLSIGQGNLRTSPIQLTNVINGVANDGQIYKPQILDRVVNNDGRVKKDIAPELFKELNISDEIIDLIKEGLVGVTTYGTARNAFIDFPINIAGKTGTAQTGGGRPNHGWFGGFAPAEEPEISVVVFIEYGGSSSNTLPVARGILEHYFEIDSDIEEDEDLLPDDLEIDLEIDPEVEDVEIDDYILEME